MGYCDVSVLLGKTLMSIVDRGDELVFTTTDGDAYRMYHRQDCCESVGLEETIGDLNDLIGSPILEAEESSNQSAVGFNSQTWTFYKFGTIKGHVTLRWLGESNGYYSESVDFEKLV